MTKEEIRENNYNLNIPRYVNSSDDPETWDMYGIMFGGIPKDELNVFSAFFEVLQGLEQDLFAESDTPYTEVKVRNIDKTIQNHPSVATFVGDFKKAFSDFQDFLEERLIDQMEELNIAEEEENITQHIFTSLTKIPLVDRYEAYQLFSDKWPSIAQDLEIIQSEGFKATRKVDPNMVAKKKDDKEYEVQEGWVGRILPFDLVQTTYLKEEWTELQQMEERLEQASEDIDVTFDELEEEERNTVSNDDGVMILKEIERRITELLSDIESEEIDTLEEYLLCTRKKEKQTFIASHPDIDWESLPPAKDGIYTAKTIKDEIVRLRENYPFDEDSTEAKFLKISSLSAEVKKLKAEIKRASEELHERTKETIEQELSDEKIRHLLYLKWIETLSAHLMQLPSAVVDEFARHLCERVRKYDTTLMDVEQDIREASESLATMIDDLTGSEYDMKALAEFKQLLLNE